MKATPKTISIGFAFSLYFWAVLTASRNAARFFSGEFSVISPLRHVGLVFITAVLAIILYFALRYALPDRFERPRQTQPLSLPAPNPVPRAIGAVAGPSKAQHTPLLPPPSSARGYRIGKADRGFILPHAEQPRDRFEQGAYDAMLEIALRHVPAGKWFDLTPWSDGGTRSYVDTMNRWYRDVEYHLLLKRIKKP